MLAHRLRFRLWALALAAFAAACSFPSVEYDDAAGTCSVTGTCAEQAAKCGVDGQREHDICGLKCANKPDPMCQSTCDTTLALKLSECAATCEGCAKKQGCQEAATSCNGLVGSN